MSLEAGKTYRTRDGKYQVTVADNPDLVSTYPFVGQINGQPLSWTAEGGVCHSVRHPIDLVEEVKPAVQTHKPAIPNADLIRAALDGKVVQWHRINTDEWYDYSTPAKAVTFLINNAPGIKWRLKPEAIVRWHAVWPVGYTGDGYSSREALLDDASCNEWEGGFKLLRIELDPETLAVIDATTEDV